MIVSTEFEGVVYMRRVVHREHDAGHDLHRQHDGENAANVHSN